MRSYLVVFKQLVYFQYQKYHADGIGTDLLFPITKDVATFVNGRDRVNLRNSRGGAVSEFEGRSRSPRIVRVLSLDDALRAIQSEECRILR
jgi:hypothetical protein